MVFVPWCDFLKTNITKRTCLMKLHVFLLDICEKTLEAYICNNIKGNYLE